MLGSIKYNLSHLLDFSGRDARQTFWFYVLFLFVVYLAFSMVAGLLLVGSIVGPIVEIANTGASEQEMDAQVAQMMGGMMGRLMGMVIWFSIAVSAVMDMLLAAAFVRRLHDSDSSGWWALAVLASQIVSTAVMIPMIDAMQGVMAQAMDPANMADPARMQAMMAGQSRFSLYGLVGWIGPIAVIVFGVLDSTDGPNRYGEAPVRF